MPTDEDAALALLATGELSVVGRMLDASNATFLCSVQQADGEDDSGGEDDSQRDAGKPVRCVYKPVRGERPLDDFPPRTLSLRERAAYLLSEASGWDLVPPTVLRGGPFGRGMVQLWIEPDPGTDVVAMVTSADDRLRRICVYDVIANNADRKGGHLLPVAGGHVYGVDHGICFAAAPKLRTVLWAWRGTPLAAAELAAVERIRLSLDGELGAALAELLSTAEIDAAIVRAETLLSSRRFPQPDPARPAIPWPPF